MVDTCVPENSLVTGPQMIVSKAFSVAAALRLRYFSLTDGAAHANNKTHTNTFIGQPAGAVNASNNKGNTQVDSNNTHKT